MKKTLNNNVLLRLHVNNVFNDKITFKSGYQLFLTHNPNELRDTVNTKWEVVTAPEKLTFKKFPAIKNDMDHKVPVEIQQGDFVYVVYTKVIEALGSKVTGGKNVSPSSYIDGEYCYIIVPYVRLIMMERNGEIQPLNGKLICEVKEKKLTSKTIILPPSIEPQKAKLSKAKIIYKGLQATEMFDFKLQKWVSLGMSEISVGDTILFKSGLQIKVDYSLSANSDLYFIDSCHVMAKVEE